MRKSKHKAPVLVYRSKILARTKAMPRGWTESYVSFKCMWKAKGKDYLRNKRIR